MIRAAPLLKRLRRRLPDFERLGLAYALVPPASAAVASVLHLPRTLWESPPGLSDDLTETACAQAFVSSALRVRSPDDFEAVYRRGEERLADAAGQVCALCERILEPYRGSAFAAEPNHALRVRRHRRGATAVPPGIPRIPAFNGLDGAVRDAQVSGGAGAAPREDPTRRSRRRPEARSLRALLVPFRNPGARAPRAGPARPRARALPVDGWRSFESPCSLRNSEPCTGYRSDASTRSGAGSLLEQSFPAPVVRFLHGPVIAVDSCFGAGIYCADDLDGIAICA